MENTFLISYMVIMGTLILAGISFLSYMAGAGIIKVCKGLPQWFHQGLIGLAILSGLFLTVFTIQGAYNATRYREVIKAIDQNQKTPRVKDQLEDVDLVIIAKEALR